VCLFSNDKIKEKQTKKLEFNSRNKVKHIEKNGQLFVTRIMWMDKSEMSTGPVDRQVQLGQCFRRFQQVGSKIPECNLFLTVD